MLHRQMTERASAQLEIDYLRDELMKAKELLKSVKHAKQVLRKNGYAVEHLWCADEVTENYECDQEMAMTILNKAMSENKIVFAIFDMIDEIAKDFQIKQI